jgi:hypothetical protein
MYRTSGIGISIVLIAAGAVLAWAVDAEVQGVDLTAVGVILFIVGLVGLIVSLLISAAPRTHVRDTTVVDRDPAADPHAGRTSRVERERIDY